MRMLIGIYFVILGLASLEIVQYYGFVRTFLPFQLWQLVLLYLGLLVGWRLWARDVSLPTKLLAFNSKLLPIMIVLLLATYLPNIFNARDVHIGQFRLNHFPFLELAGMSYFTQIFAQTWDKIRSQWATILFWGFIFSCFLLYTYASHIFAIISYNGGGEYDDNFMEWLQVGVLGLGMITSLIMAIRDRQGVGRKVLFLLGVAGFIFLAGEEISWGERIWNFETQISESNYQQELNLHNQKGFNELASVMYYLVFLYALFSTKFRGKVGSWKELFIFKKIEVLYLLPSFLFNPYLDRTIIQGYPTMLDLYFKIGIVPDYIRALEFLAAWRESFEVLFYGGLVIHLLNIYLANFGVKMYSKSPIKRPKS